MAPICSVCGKELKNPNSSTHIKSKDHQNALHGIKPVKKTIKQTKKRVTESTSELLRRIESLEKRVSYLESIISSSKKNGITQSITIKNMDLEQFFTLLKEIYLNIPNKVGDMAAIPIIVKDIKNKTSLNIKDIEENIYKLFVKNLVDLQPGKARLGRPIIIDGYKFYWLRILGG